MPLQKNFRRGREKKAAFSIEVVFLFFWDGRKKRKKKNGKGRKNKDIYGHILLRDAWQSEKGHTIDLAETAWMFVGAIGAWALGWPTTEKDPENNLIDIYDGPTRQCTHDCARQDRYINMYRIFCCRLHREAGRQTSFYLYILRGWQFPSILCRAARGASIQQPEKGKKKAIQFFLPSKIKWLSIPSANDGVADSWIADI